MPYEPFVIGDLDQGLDISKEAFIAPEKAWRELSNGYVFRGRLWKRKGYDYFSTLGTKRSQTLAGTVGLTVISGTLDRRVVLPKKGTYAVTFSDGGGQTVVDVSPIFLGDEQNPLLGQLKQGASVVGSINYQTGAYSFTLGAAAANNVVVTYEFRRVSTNGASYSTTPAEADQNATMLINNFIPNPGNEILLAIDRRRIFKWNLADERMVDLEYPAADRWSSCTTSSFFHTAPYLSRMVIVNGLDTCFYYDAGLDQVKELASDWVDNDNPGAGGYVRQIDSALMAFLYQQRLVLLRTAEGGQAKYQRARWSKVAPDFSQSSSFLPTDYVDAPTHDRIVSAGFLRNTLVVFFESSVWALVWRDDFRQPFIWQKIAELEGSLATRSTVSFPDSVITMGPTAPVITDGQNVRRAGDEIPDIVLSWNTAKIPMCFGAILQEVRQALVTYADQGEPFPEHVLAYQYESGAYSLYDLPFHTFGLYKQTTSLTWDEMDTLFPTFDDWIVPFDDFTQTAGFPIMLGGMVDCRIWRVFQGQSDNGAAIQLRAMTQRLNPYREQQRRVRLGYVDITARRDAGSTLKLRFFKDFSGSAYLERTITLDGSPSFDQVKKRILVNQTGAFHQIELEHSGSEGVAIDQIVLWMAPVSESRAIA